MANEEWKDAFNLFDKDNDGKISSQEVGTVMRALGQTLTQSELNTIIKEIGGPNVQIDFNGFVGLMQKRSKTDVEQQIKDAFKTLDKTGSGSIEVKELRHLLTSIGEKLSVEEVDTVLKEADSNNDGLISLQDFLRVIKSIK